MRLLFDSHDLELLAIVNDVLHRDTERKGLKRLFDPLLHPHGIKEMAAPQALRIAYAVINLLDSLDVGKAGDRIQALRSLQDEILNIGQTDLPRNTARVLLQIMKEIVRSKDHPERQIELAHDFRLAASGKPRIIHRQMERNHLLEMPEAWNQLAFDDHVHDAHTKGRKSPTHLIMDAWIKGIRRLTVVYYNYIRPEAAEELFQAAEIVGIQVRVGLSLMARFYDRYAHFICIPRGFPNVKEFLLFLSEPKFRAFLAEGEKVSLYQQRHVLAVLERFNRKHRFDLEARYGIEVPELDAQSFLAYVGYGQASLLHLGEFIHQQIAPQLEVRGQAPREGAGTDEQGPREPQEPGEERRCLDSEKLVDLYLRPSANPELPDPSVPSHEEDLPPLLRLGPRQLLERLYALHGSYRITLNLSNLHREDVLEILYDCGGLISRLEIFNLKDYVAGKTAHLPDILSLQKTINEGNVVGLKKHVRSILQHLQSGERPGDDQRSDKFREILQNILLLQAWYQKTPLASVIGSDSTSRSHHGYGMGLVVRETLPKRAQKIAAQAHQISARPIPVLARILLQRTYRLAGAQEDGLRERLSRRFPVLRFWLHPPRDHWMVDHYDLVLGREGNILPLGGFREEEGGGTSGEPRQTRPASSSWSRLNSGLKNALKILCGFIPAFLTFALTKEWWLLAYGGAFVWFGITGMRNILQSVLGGGGLRRSPLLRWKEYVSWDRVSDSLLFTGFSVPLLDYVTKTVLLDNLCGITTSTHPAILYTVMSLANGLYLSSHNAFRGLPRGAVFGNFFRSILSIPLAIGLNALAGGILGLAHIPEVNDVLQKWAAIITKGASDCVAGFIEGLADRTENIRMRARDYQAKFRQLLDTYARLELHYPETDVLALLESPQTLLDSLNKEAGDLEKMLIINALDLLYFWLYQPRARSVMRKCMARHTPEEQQIIVRSQSVLRREREISQLFIDGLIGRNFAKGLAFYLDHYRSYIDSLTALENPPPPEAEQDA